MVQAMIEINEHANRVLNIIKAKYGLGNKSEAVEFVVKRFEDKELEDALKPINCAIASEKTLAKHWNSKTEDKAWKNL